MSRCCKNCPCTCKRLVDDPLTPNTTVPVLPFYDCDGDECTTGYFTLEENGFTRDYFNEFGGTRFKGCLPYNFQEVCGSFPPPIVDGYYVNNREKGLQLGQPIGSPYGQPTPFGQTVMRGACFTQEIFTSTGSRLPQYFIPSITRQGVKAFMGINNVWEPRRVANVIPNENVPSRFGNTDLGQTLLTLCADSIDDINIRYAFSALGASVYFYRIKGASTLGGTTVDSVWMGGPANRFIPQNNTQFNAVIYWPGGITGTSDAFLSPLTANGSMSLDVSCLIIASLQSLNGCKTSTIVQNWTTITTNSTTTGSDDLPIPWDYNDIIEIDIYPFIHYQTQAASGPINTFASGPTGLQVGVPGFGIIDQQKFYNTINGAQSNVIVGTPGQVAWEFKGAIQVSARHRIYHKATYDCNGNIVYSDPDNTVQDVQYNNSTTNNAGQLTDVDCDVLADFSSCDTFKEQDIDTEEQVFREMTEGSPYYGCSVQGSNEQEVTETNSRHLEWSNAACDYYISTSCGYVDKTISVGGAIHTDDVTLTHNGTEWVSAGGAKVEFGNFNGWAIKYTRANGEEIYGTCSSNCTNPPYFIVNKDIDGGPMTKYYINNGLLA